MIIYSEVIEVLAIDPVMETARVRISMAELDVGISDASQGLDSLSAEQRKKFEKEIARKKAKAEKNNPGMQKIGTGKFGGYMTPYEKTVPVSEILPGAEKAELRNIRRRHRKGHFADMIRYHGSDNLQEALARFYEKLKGQCFYRAGRGFDPAGCLQVELVRKK